MGRVHNHHAVLARCTQECPVHPLHGIDGPASMEELLEERARLIARVAELEAEISGLRAVGIR